MGFFRNLLLGGSASGGGNLTALPKTPEGAGTPSDPGHIAPFRSVPALTKPRYFGKYEAKALKELAQEKQEEAQATGEACQALASISGSDAHVTKSFYQYRTIDAKNGLQQLKAQANYQKALIGMKPAFEEVKLELGLEDKKSKRKIERRRNDVKRAMALLSA